ncbi:UNVERIFIED_CONTAM: RnlB antitoxin of RnlAB toxin-antitoxin system [Acetivibrio alkalicellulosi]
MNEFDILDLLDNNEYKLLVVFKTPEPPLQYLDEVSKVLVNKSIKGFILIDELIHSGNN